MIEDAPIQEGELRRLHDYYRLGYLSLTRAAKQAGVTRKCLQRMWESKGWKVLGKGKRVYEKPGTINVNHEFIGVDDVCVVCDQGPHR